MYGVKQLDTVQCVFGKQQKSVFMGRKIYSSVSYGFDHMTLVFLHKAINYGVVCLLSRVV